MWGKFVLTLLGVGLLQNLVHAGPRRLVPETVPSEVIVRLQGKFNPTEARRLLNTSGSRIVEVLSPDLNLFLVKVSAGAERNAIASLTGSTKVAYAQANHIVKNRQTARAPIKLPDDPHYAKLWNLEIPSNQTGAGVSARRVWQVSQGGVDMAGNEIVVAPVDDGFDLGHEDLKDNFFINKNEIPGNGKDDDGNGYVDDVNGWNAYTSTGQIKPSLHGTHVSGIVGARGNNAIGVTGVNWKVKIMPVMGSSGTTATVAKAYNYVLTQKKLWLASKGKLGANVVSTNSSFGVDYADCKSGDFPVWNDLYDAMGKVGILSAAATANENIDVDVKGDVPTGCESDYLISVTNTQRDDKRNKGAAYGKKHVDLGAPGTEIFSTVPDSKYQALTGTSMATPHVAGAVALLHSVARLDFLLLSVLDPGAAALVLKDSLLQGVDKNADLEGITVSGGRMNIARAAQLLTGKKYNVRRN
ncbi:MAG: S8 family serine peptidase [Bdellovibrionales bacterium]|nr:S8 family serine peptidase [Bdellovibrionales bacterium]